MLHKRSVIVMFKAMGCRVYPGKPGLHENILHNWSTKIATSCRKTPRQWMWWLSMLQRLRKGLQHSWPPLHYEHPANNPEPAFWDPPVKDFNRVQKTRLKCLHLLVQCISTIHPQTGLVLQIQRSFPSHSSYTKGPSFSSVTHNWMAPYTAAVLVL